MTGTMAVPAGLRFQTIDVGEVADALTDAALGSAAGRVSDIGGPQVLSLEEMADRYRKIAQRSYAVASQVADSPQFYEAFRHGLNLTPDHAVGRITWDDFLRESRSRS